MRTGLAEKRLDGVDTGRRCLEPAHSPVIGIVVHGHQPSSPQPCHSIADRGTCDFQNSGELGDRSEGMGEDRQQNLHFKRFEAVGLDAAIDASPAPAEFERG